MTEHTIHDNLSIEQLIDHINTCQVNADAADTLLKQAKNALIARKQEEVSAALKEKPEPFGAVSQIIGGFKVTITTPKKVKWNQDGLKQLSAQMLADGADPEEYIDTELSVAESKYKNWPSNLKEYFEPHRTVEPGTVSLKIEPAKGK